MYIRAYKLQKKREKEMRENGDTDFRTVKIEN